MQSEDKKLAIEILTESFLTNPSVNFIVGNGKNKIKRVRKLMQYSVEVAEKNNGVLLSSDRTGAALFFRVNTKNEIKPTLWQDVKLAATVIRHRLFALLQREKTKNALKKKEEHLYLWFYGVTIEGRGKGAAKELQQNMFRQSKELDLPIYLETSVYANKLKYEKYGFQTFGEVKFDKNQVLYLLRRPAYIL